MEIDEGIFYKSYDLIAPIVFRKYNERIKIAANAIPLDITSGLELGVGTGTFSAEVKKRLGDKKGLDFYGIDLNFELASFAKAKVEGLKFILGDILDVQFPKVDVIYSSLTIHHAPTQRREELLQKIAYGVRRGFVNMDLVIDEKTDFDDVVDLVSKNAVENVSDETMILLGMKPELRGEIPELIRRRMLKNDNYMSIDFQKRFFENLGLEFKILDYERPFIVYSAFWPSKKS